MNMKYYSCYSCSKVTMIAGERGSKCPSVRFR